MHLKKLSPWTCLILFTMLSIWSMVLTVTYLGNGLPDIAYVCIFYYYVISIIGIFYFENISYASIMFLFNSTCFLFLGGRFLAYPFIGEGGFFNLNFMTEFYATADGEAFIFLLLLSFLLFANMAYALAGYKIKDSSLSYTYEFDKVALFITFIVVILLFAILVKGEFSKLSQTFGLGYLSRYASQAAEYESGSGLAVILFTALCGVLVSNRNSNISIFVFFMFFIYALFFILAGQRGPFVSTLLLGVWWLYSKRHVGLTKVSLFFLFCFIVLNILLLFSPRSIQGDYGFFYKLINFLNLQGTTLGILSYGVLEVSDYPEMAYRTTFFPGVARIISIFTGETFFPQDLGFGAYTAYMANPEMYKSGYGMGWSIIGNLYFFSGKVLFIFLLLSFGCGAFIKKIEVSGQVKQYWFGMSVVLAAPLFFVARAEIRTLIHFAIIYSLLYFLMKSFLFRKVGPLDR